MIWAVFERKKNPPHVCETCSVVIETDRITKEIQFFVNIYYNVYYANKNASIFVFKAKTWIEKMFISFCVEQSNNDIFIFNFVLGQRKYNVWLKGKKPICKKKNSKMKSRHFL